MFTNMPFTLFCTVLGFAKCLYFKASPNDIISLGSYEKTPAWIFSFSLEMDSVIKVASLFATLPYFYHSEYIKLKESRIRIRQFKKIIPQLNGYDLIQSYIIPFRKIYLNSALMDYISRSSTLKYYQAGTRDFLLTCTEKQDRRQKLFNQLIVRHLPRSVLRHGWIAEFINGLDKNKATLILEKSWFAMSPDEINKLMVLEGGSDSSLIWKTLRREGSQLIMQLQAIKLLHAWRVGDNKKLFNKLYGKEIKSLSNILGLNYYRKWLMGKKKSVSKPFRNAWNYFVKHIDTFHEDNKTVTIILNTLIEMIHVSISFEKTGLTDYFKGLISFRLREKFIPANYRELLKEYCSRVDMNDCTENLFDITNFGDENYVKMLPYWLRSLKDRALIWRKEVSSSQSTIFPLTSGQFALKKNEVTHQIIVSNFHKEVFPLLQLQPPQTLHGLTYFRWNDLVVALVKDMLSSPLMFSISLKGDRCWMPTYFRGNIFFFFSSIRILIYEGIKIDTSLLPGRDLDVNSSKCLNAEFKEKICSTQKKEGKKRYQYTLRNLVESFEWNNDLLNYFLWSDIIDLLAE